MTKQLKEIGERLKGLREAEDVAIGVMARKMDITELEYRLYETGESDFSFSFLYNAAQILNVDVTDIISGESPKLSTCSLVKKGQGFEIKRRAAYDYRHLAYTFKNKRAEPFLVTVSPKNETPALHAHEGQEFDYMLSGEMLFFLDGAEYLLREGDCVYYDSQKPHAMNAVGGDAQFLAVVIK